MYEVSAIFILGLIHVAVCIPSSGSLLLSQAGKKIYIYYKIPVAQNSIKHKLMESQTAGHSCPGVADAGGRDYKGVWWNS